MSVRRTGGGARRLVIADYVQYIALAAGVLLLFVFVRQIAGVILIFLAAAILAYVLNPVVKRVERLGSPRAIAVLGVFAALGAVLGVAGLALIVPAVRQIQSLVSNPQLLVDGAAQIVDRARTIPCLGDQIGGLDRQSLMSQVQRAAPFAQTASRVLTGFVGGVFSTIFNLFLLAIISIYLLVDRDRVTNAALWALPETVRDQTVEMLEVVEHRFVKFIKGQLLLCLLMGAIGWAIVQFTIGSYAIALGLWVGLMEFIPVIGAFLGAVPAVAVALLVSPVQGLIVAGLFLIAQQIEGNLLVPKVIGDSGNVHSPVGTVRRNGGLGPLRHHRSPLRPDGHSNNLRHPRIPERDPALRAVAQAPGLTGPRRRREDGTGNGTGRGTAPA